MLWAVAFLAVVVYLVVVDFGISAGRIHHGVTVNGVELGGLTRAEALVRLRPRALDLSYAPVSLIGHGLDRSLRPTEVVWRPLPGRTAAAALAVGRTGGPLDALWDRFRSWFVPVEVDWIGRPNADAMVKFVSQVDRDAGERDLVVDRALLRRRLKQALATWPRRPVLIPLKG
jgi:hypothetical protein